MRASGILMHISSLPSPYGIGTFGAAAFDFADFLEKSGQRYWQILPLGPTSYGDSPYQSFSTFAGNPYFIDLDLLCAEGLLEKDEYRWIDWGQNPSEVEYDKIYENRFAVLRLAFRRGFGRDGQEIGTFRATNAAWLEDYALFMALKDYFGGKAWSDWTEDIRLRRSEAMDFYRKLLQEEIDFWVYLQYQFFNQLRALRCYAGQKGILLLGDLPIYVAMDSADVWANPQLFWLNEDCRPTFVAGVPPDYFSPDGQLWGNPLYHWQAHQESGYAWWISRIQAAAESCDLLRIDHFRGFSTFYAVPAQDENAKNGHWEKGPGYAFFQEVQARLGKLNLIAEDLGALTSDVFELLGQCGYPGMKVLEFAFDSNWNNVYLPHNHIQNCVVYTGTHDNDTVAGWWKTALCEEDKRHATEYLGLSEEEGIHWGMIRGTWASVADLAIVPMQDFLGFGSEARMNLPATLGGNWRFRVQQTALSDQLAEQIEHVSGLYQRSTH